MRRHLLPTVCAALFLLDGCVPYAQMQMENNAVVLALETVQSRLEAVPLRQKRISFISLYLTQTILKTKSDNLLVYENAELDSNYEFRQTVARTLDIVFESFQKRAVASVGGIEAYQVVLPKRGVLNVLVQEKGIFNLTLLYGMSNAQLKQMLIPLHTKIASLIEKDVIVLHHPDNAILTKWDVIKVRFYPLVGRIPRPFNGL